MNQAFVQASLFPRLHQTAEVKTTRFPNLGRHFWGTQEGLVIWATEGLVNIDKKTQVFAWGRFLILPEYNTWNIFLLC